MKVDLEKIKKAKGRTYINVEDCPIPICVDDYLEYKKIEKELGIDLSILFKALRNGVYVKEDNGFRLYNVVLTYNGTFALSTDYSMKYGKQGLVCDLDKYGTYWALTKEELL